MSQYVTTHNAEGKAVFSTKVPEQQHALPLPGGSSLTFLYMTHGMPLDLSTESDIDQYAEDRLKGLPPGSPAPPNGTSAAIARLAANATTPMRRTISLGVFAVIRGEVMLKLDGGEERRFEVGDAAVLRCALHSWTNVTPDNGEAKILVFAQYVEAPEIHGKKSEKVW